MGKVAIGVPLYNEEQYISATAQSVINQLATFSDVEVYISDNCSTDTSAKCVKAVIEGSGADKSRIKFSQKAENVGPASNFWSVFDESDSDYFLWVGAHDQLSGNYVKEGVALLDAMPRYNLFCGSHAVMTADPASPPVGQDILYSFDQENQVERYLQSIAQLQNCYVFHSLFRRKSLEGYSRPQCPSADHIIISRLLWYGALYQSSSVKYARRYFPKERREKKSSEGGYVTSNNNLAFYEGYVADLEVLSSRLSENVRKMVLQQAMALLVQRFGIPHVAPDITDG